VGLVSERKRGGTNTVKTRDHVVKGRERVGKGGCSGRKKEAVLQQESVVTVEIHDDLFFRAHYGRERKLFRGASMGGRSGSN